MPPLPQPSLTRSFWAEKQGSRRTTINQVRDDLLEFNPSKSMGPDRLHPTVLGELAHVVKRPL